MEDILVVGAVARFAEFLEGTEEVGGPEALPDDGEGGVFGVDGLFVVEEEEAWVLVVGDSGFGG